MSQSARSNLLRSLLSLALLAGAAWIFFNRVYIVDQITVWRYQPDSAMSSIADKSSLSDYGRFLLYASRPRVEPAASFNAHCRQHAEKTAVLGCYVNRQIFIYDITDERLTGIKEVTAAHEMLHAAYDRLSQDEQTRLHGLIDQAMQSIDDASLRERLEVYDRIEPGERYNELHSILGSEIKNLPHDLELHYDTYFTNRLSLVATYDRYESVFRELKAKQTELVDHLNALARRIDEQAKAYTAAFESLTSDISAFNTRAESGGFSSATQFASERRQLLARQEALSAERHQLQTMIADYDGKKAELDALNVQAEDLQRSIDSTPLPQVPVLQQ